MIAEVVEVLRTIDRRLEIIEDVLPKLTDRINDVSQTVADPSGYVTVSGKVNTPIDTLRDETSAKVHLESVMLDAKFTNAVYLGTKLQDNPELEELMGSAAVQQVKNTVDLVSKLHQLVHACEMKVVDLEVANAQFKDNMKLNIRKVAEDVMKDVEDRTNKAVAFVEKENDKLERALARLESACKKAEALSSTVNNGVTVKSTPSSFVSRKL